MANEITESKLTAAERSLALWLVDNGRPEAAV